MFVSVKLARGITYTNIERFLTIPVCRCNISNQCDCWEVNQLGQMLQFQQHLFRAYFFKNDVICRAL